MEYLNENLDQLKSFNRLTRNIENELDHYRCAPAADSAIFATAEKSCPQTRSIKIDLEPGYRKTVEDFQLSTESSSSDNNFFFQTLTEFSKKLKKILTPKNENISNKRYGDYQEEKLSVRSQNQYSERYSLFPMTSARGTNLLVTNPDGVMFRKSVINLIKESERYSVLNPVTQFVCDEQYTVSSPNGKAYGTQLSNVSFGKSANLIFDNSRNSTARRKSSISGVAFIDLCQPRENSNSVQQTKREGNERDSYQPTRDSSLQSLDNKYRDTSLLPKDSNAQRNSALKFNETGSRNSEVPAKRVIFSEKIAVTENIKSSMDISQNSQPTEKSYTKIGPKILDHDYERVFSGLDSRKNGKPPRSSQRIY